LIRKLLAIALLVIPFAQGQPPPGGRGGRGAPVSPKEGAAFDMTGYWVSIVTEDWRFRMVTAPKGQFGGVPLNAEGRKVANEWDPAKEEAAGNQCKAYGAAGLMRLPGRLHITWADDKTLKIETDAGTQTRLFHFGGSVPAGTESSWQGYSVASWEYAAGGGRGAARSGDLHVVTTNLRAGFLRKNGIPYSANAVVTEWYDRIKAPNGDDWLVVSTEVRDPQYLTMPFITSTHFKKQPDATGWAPEACSAR
jgi:hypothetical protein